MVRDLRLKLLLVAMAAMWIGGIETSFARAESSGGDRRDQQATKKLILDTDMDSDCDDAAALGILHAMIDRGETELLAVMVSGTNRRAGPCVDAINTYYGRPDIPIGTARPPAPDQPSLYAEGVARRCPHDLVDSMSAPDSVELYRSILMAQPDESVTIVTVGDMTNLAKLLELPRTPELPSGKEVIERKVAHWVCMGGNFIGKPARDDLKVESNNNFTLDSKATFAAITKWPRPITFVGREIGSTPSGLEAGELLRKAPADHPVRIAYELYFGGVAKNRHIADLTTVLYAVRGLGDYWDIEDQGAMELEPNMTFRWNYDSDRDHAYLLRKRDDRVASHERVEQAINDLMLVPPGKPRGPSREGQ
jgi:hypothetical protein